MTISVATLGFPRIGPRRELKFALESFWSGKSDADALSLGAQGLRAAAWARQKALGADIIPSGDFSLYDHVLDTSAMLGAVPARYGWSGGKVGLDTYFAMARGAQSAKGHEGCAHGLDSTAQEMTKWFDTNYHYMVPELSAGQAFALSSSKAVDEFLEAKALGYHTRPVLLGPVTWLTLAKGKDVAPLSLLDAVLPVYEEVLAQLAQAGADWVQIDEPCLVLDLDDDQRAALKQAYRRLSVNGPKVMLATYFGALGDNLELATDLPVHGLHIDLVRAPEQLEQVWQRARPDLLLSLGVIDGRNVWRADLDALIERIAPVAAECNLVLAPSCSLLHVPVDLAIETALDPEVKQWLAFAVQKISELSVLAEALNRGAETVAEPLALARAAVESRKTSPLIHNPAVAARLAAVDLDMTRRNSPFADRRAAQQARLGLPSFPTTTIGSFPQTPEVR
jgi:5-methyltetrahydropteroyltriglutamate--homocysteine methyltransferase